MHHHKQSSQPSLRIRIDSSRLLFLYCRKVKACPLPDEEQGRRDSLCTRERTPATDPSFNVSGGGLDVDLADGSVVMRMGGMGGLASCWECWRGGRGWRCAC